MRDPFGWFSRPPPPEEESSEAWIGHAIPLISLRPTGQPRTSPAEPQRFGVFDRASMRSLDPGRASSFLLAYIGN